MDQNLVSTGLPSWRQRMAFAFAALVSGAAAGSVTAMIQSRGVFLVGLQSLGIGLFMGLLLLGMSAVHARRLPRWPVALLAGIIAVVVEHVCLYRFALAGRRDAVARKPAVEFFRPGWSEQSFWSYFAEEATMQAVLWWTLDAVLLVAAAVVIVEMTFRKHAPPPQ